MIPRLVLLSLVVVLNAQWSPAEVRSALETRNAALRYWMAFAEMKDPPADKSLQDLLERTSLGQAAWDEAKLGPILDSNGEALQAMQRATKLPECDWGIEYSRGPRAPIAYLARARVMARLSALQAMREMSAGDSQAAMERWIAGIRFASHLAKGINTFAAPCDGAAGVSTDELIAAPKVDRLYVFSPKPWTPISLKQAMEDFQR